MSIIRFILFVLLALLLVSVPLLEVSSYPFRWLETYFHEVSHGLVSVLTGGKVVNITLEWNGAGRCNYISDHPTLVLFFGYAGATIWGALIYSGALGSVRIAHRIALVVLLLLVSTGILWIHPEPKSILILLAMTSIIFFPLWFVQYKVVQHLVQFIGIFVMVNTIRSVMKLFSIRDHGDHKRLEALTGVPVDVWTWSWLVFSLIVMMTLWYMTYVRSR